MPKGRKKPEKGHRIEAGEKVAGRILCLREEKRPEKGIESRQEQGNKTVKYA